MILKRFHGSSTFPVDNFVRNRTWNTRKRLLGLVRPKIAHFRGIELKPMKSTS